jgi:hypothetical protein
MEPPFRTIELNDTSGDKRQSWYSDTYFTPELIADESAFRFALLASVPAFVDRSTAIVTRACCDPDGFNPDLKAWRVLVYGKGSP